jgi:FkbM family methyltransferase
MRLPNNTCTVLKNPKIALAFARWTILRLFGVSPRIRFRKLDRQSLGASIGGWISFSEFWTFSELVPHCEEKLCSDTLAHSGKQAVAVDIGANIGVFACRIASLGFSVHAFEPIPETFERLRQNVEFNELGPMVYLNRIAVGAEVGTVSFETPANSPAQNRITISGGERTIEVPVIRLDDYCSDQNIQTIDFLKIDVEGMETRVIRGARRLLSEKRIAVILIEVCPWNLLNAGTSPEELFTIIDEYNYEPHRLLRTSEIGMLVTASEFAEINCENLVLLPRP